MYKVILKSGVVVNLDLVQGMECINSYRNYVNEYLSQSALKLSGYVGNTKDGDVSVIIDFTEVAAIVLA
jgi:acylphosphatase